MGKYQLDDDRPHPGHVVRLTWQVIVICEMNDTLAQVCTSEKPHSIMSHDNLTRLKPRLGNITNLHVSIHKLHIHFGHVESVTFIFPFVDPDQLYFAQL